MLWGIFCFERRKQMCLREIWSDDKMNKWLNGQPDVIEVVKAVSEGSNHWLSYHRLVQCVAGYSKANYIPKIITDDESMYFAGYHFFTKESVDSRSKEGDPITPLIKCLVKKDWITAIGNQWSWATVLVASEAVFPHYPETEARYEDLPKEVPLKKENVTTT